MTPVCIGTPLRRVSEPFFENVVSSPGYAVYNKPIENSRVICYDKNDNISVPNA